MKKQWALLLSLVLALVMSVFAAACVSDPVTVSISQVTAEVTVGKTVSLTATASDGSEVVWSTDNEAVATVTDRGKVLGVSAGTAVITASAGEASATCTVTVKEAVVITFKDANGAELTEATVNREGTLQLSATASDGSEITAWSSSNPEVASVSETGLVTGIFDGEANITARTATGSGALKVTVVDTAEGKYMITTENVAGKWWYYVNTDGGRATVVNRAEFRNDIVTFDFGGEGNWYKDDIQLGISDPTISTGWHKVTATINSSFAGKVTILGTVVNLVVGDNQISVAYEQKANDVSFFMVFFGDGELIGTGKVEISNVVWSDFTPVALVTPSFTLSGNDVKITDSANKDGVTVYQIGLFTENGKDPVFSQSFTAAGGTLDTSSCEQNGEFIVRIRAVGNVGYTNSAWSSANDVKYTVSNDTLSYDLDGTGESTALNSGRWTFWAGDGGTASEAKYENGTVTLTGQIGWAWYSVQLFRHYAQFTTGTVLKVSMKITSTAAGTITITGQHVALQEGENDVELFITQSNGATLSIQLAVMGENNMVDETVSMPTYTDITLTISNVEVAPFVAEALQTPSFTVENGKVNITDPNTKGVAGYQLGFFDGDTLVGYVNVANGGEFTDSAIKDGSYTVKVRAVAQTGYENSEWSATGISHTVANGGVTYDIMFGGEQDTPNAATNPGTWYYWNDQNWCGSDTRVSAAKFANGTITFTYKAAAGACDFGLQAFYKDPTLTEGKTYKLTLTINVTYATQVTINGEKISLVPGNNDIFVAYNECTGTGVNGHWVSFAMQVVVNVEQPNENTITMSNLKWEEYTLVALNAPTVSIANDGVVTVTDGNAAGVASYVVGFFVGDATNPVATVTVENGKAIDVSKIENGTYTVKIMAKASSGFTDSAWSAGSNYTVNNVGGVKYDMESTGSEGALATGNWTYWVGDGGTATEVKYENGTVTFKGQSGWAFYSAQLFRNYSEYEAGTVLKITMKINSNKAGKITVCGQVVELKEGENTVTVTVTQTAGAPTISIQLGVWSEGNLTSTDSLPTYQDLVITVSDVVVEPQA